MKIWLVLYVFGHVAFSSDVTKHGFEWCENASHSMHEVMLGSEELLKWYGKTAVFGCTMQPNKPQVEYLTGAKK